MRGYIYITLKSDLCVANGDGFSLSIDTDVCDDKYGFPFIPSRRLKGCLREAAEYIGCDQTNSIFGVSGNVNSGSLRINDARLENYYSLAAQAVNSKYNAEQVLALFTSVKASTAIENDTAKENTLRFTRVVNHYSPFDERELVFISEIEYAEGDEVHLERICKALRNIGYKRTRGYGSVRCVFTKIEERKALEINIPDNDKEYELGLVVKLRSAAMFPGKSSMETTDYIPGSALLGAFAGCYLKNGGDESDFDILFLSGAVKFSNMYISNGQTASEPAPAVLGKAKGSSEIRFVFRDKNDDASKPLVKAFKGGYLINGSELKPEKEVIYHHGKKQGEESKLLYTQECLCEGQLFSGYITGTGKALRKLMPTIADRRLNLGRSKSAQYSACDIIAVECVPVSADAVPAGEVYALLCSDVLLLDENAQFSTDINVLASALGAKMTGEDKAHCALKYKTVMGYISVGRYKRSHIRAFEKGSVIRFMSNKELPHYITIGERQNEGFGVIKFCKKDELMKLGRKAPELTEKEKASEGELKKLIDKNDAIEKLHISALDFAEEKYGATRNTFNPSFIGRLLLMVGQAVNEADLNSRVASVKDEKKREAAQRFIRDAKELYGEEWKLFLQLSLTVIKYKTKEAGK